MIKITVPIEGIDKEKINEPAKKVKLMNKFLIDSLHNLKVRGLN
jgi:hypothetical protein